ncbi:MAG TPA: hypothetical protein VLT62_26880 [Candidatus Methylomirabilis sp.]|nr:hypothetical protein [Candidatus Methylomirabilis sp.]
MIRLVGVTTRAMLWVGLFIVLLAGCTSAPSATGIYPPAIYAKRVSTPHVNVYWNCTQQTDTVRLEGVVQNIKGGRVTFVELELVGVGPGGGGDSSVKNALPDIVLQPNQISPFSLELRKRGEQRFDLFYVYQLDAASGEDPRPRFMARDVCLSTAHTFRRPGA